MSDPTVALAVGGIGAAIALLASPYLAALTVSAPERGVAAWWRVRPLGGMRCAATAAIAVAFAALAGAAAGWTGAWPAYLVLALAGAALSVVDVEHHRLPDRLLGPPRSSRRWCSRWSQALSPTGIRWCALSSPRRRRLPHLWSW